MPADSTETRNRILSEALFHFAEHGFDGATMRAIATRSGTSLALVQYHFRTKEQLYRAVWQSLTAPNSEIRRTQLERFDAAMPRNDALRELTSIFVTPLIAAAATERGGAFLTLVRREMFDPKAEERGVIRDFVDKDARLLVDRFAALIPAAKRSEIAQTYLWMVFAFSQILVRDGRLRRLSAPEPFDLSIEERLTLMVEFVVGGWIALANQVDRKGVAAQENA